MLFFVLIAVIKSVFMGVFCFLNLLSFLKRFNLVSKILPFAFAIFFRLES